MILVIDNYDSFTWNLVHYLEELGAATYVARNDAFDINEALSDEYQAIVLSPGPCTPNEAGICLDLLARAPLKTPILGVCLGHQAIGQAFGGRIVSARSIMHGRTSAIMHRGEGVFANLPSPFTATRYHSLAVSTDNFPSELIADAWTQDGEVMGLHHRDRPIFGVQFHPESVASEHGHALLANFLQLAGIQ
jgi:anthranilate synthase component 2